MSLTLKLAPHARAVLSQPVFSALRMPWPARRNPAALRHEPLARQQLADLGLLTDDRARRRFAGTVALDPWVYPDAPQDRLLVAAAFSQWLFFLDDQYDDDATLGRDPIHAHALMLAHFALLSGVAHTAHDPLGRLGLHLRAQLEQCTSPAWRARFLADVEAYLFRGSVVAVDHWSQDHVPTLAEYLPMRLHDSAVHAALDMIELVNASELPDALLAHPAIAELRELCVRHIAVANDLVSYQKEVLRSGTPCNVIAVLMHEGRSFTDAVTHTVTLLDADIACFLACERALPDHGIPLTPAVRQYLGGMKAWMRGNLDFSLTSQRYTAADSPFPELRCA